MSSERLSDAFSNGMCPQSADTPCPAPQHIHIYKLRIFACLHVSHGRVLPRSVTQRQKAHDYVVEHMSNPGEKGPFARKSSKLPISQSQIQMLPLNLRPSFNSFIFSPSEFIGMETKQKGPILYI